MKIRKLLSATLLFVSSTAISEQLNVVAINSGATKQVTASLLREFEQANPGIQVNFQTYPDAEYKEKLPQWLSASRAENQVYFWQGGKLKPVGAMASSAATQWLLGPIYHFKKEHTQELTPKW